MEIPTGNTLQCPDDKHPHLIDLGLPSGTKWACCNVGATSPTKYGAYYAWGETAEKSTYTWETYKYGSGWTDVEHLGYSIHETDYDVAHVLWGTPWHMPTSAQFDELINATSQSWGYQDNIYGCTFTAPNGQSLFFPAAGGYGGADGKYYGRGTYALYWSSTVNTASNSNKASAFAMSIKQNSKPDTDGVNNSFGRFYGLSVRPVQGNTQYDSLFFNVKDIVGQYTAYKFKNTWTFLDEKLVGTYDVIIRSSTNNPNELILENFWGTYYDIKGTFDPKTRDIIIEGGQTIYKDEIDGDVLIASQGYTTELCFCEKKTGREVFSDEYDKVRDSEHFELYWFKGDDIYIIRLCPKWK